MNKALQEGNTTNNIKLSKM